MATVTGKKHRYIAITALGATPEKPSVPRMTSTKGSRWPMMRSSEILATVQAANRLTPKGGVIIPSARFTTIIKNKFDAWFRLLETPGLGREGTRRLLASFGSATRVLAASRSAVQQVVGAALAEAVATEPEALSERLQAARAWLDGGEQRQVLCLGDDDFYGQSYFCDPRGKIVAEGIRRFFDDEHTADTLRATLEATRERMRKVRLDTSHGAIVLELDAAIPEHVFSKASLRR